MTVYVVATNIIVCEATAQCPPLIISLYFCLFLPFPTLVTTAHSTGACSKLGRNTTHRNSCPITRRGWRSVPRGPHSPQEEDGPGADHPDVEDGEGGGQPGHPRLQAPVAR